ncbi:MAG: rhodanese-like domain-containing protein [Oscillospiraceae bacterium]|nr:rhodanese-like domain-containing protein [Oscillospiraceae bacterium]
MITVIRTAFITFLALSFIAIFTIACKSNVEATVAAIVSGIEASRINESNSSVILLDVRSREEYKAYHIENSIVIPVDELEFRLSDLPDKDAIIIVFCKSGVRSERAAEILIANNYTNVFDMQSIDSWINIDERDLASEIDRLAFLIERLINEGGIHNNGVDYSDIPDDVAVPDGASLCGRCSGCGEYHFIWDDDFFHDHTHTSCGCDFDCHCHMTPDECDCATSGYQASCGCAGDCLCGLPPELCNCSDWVHDHTDCGCDYDCHCHLPPELCNCFE